MWGSKIIGSSEEVVVVFNGGAEQARQLNLWRRDPVEAAVTHKQQIGSNLIHYDQYS